MVTRRRWAMVLVGCVLLTGGGTPLVLSPAAADVIPGLDLPEEEGWEQPLEEEQHPAEFESLGPAPEGDPSRVSAVGPQAAVGAPKVAPLLRRSAWSWYLDPRVIEDRGRTTFGAMANNGDLQVVQIRNSDARLSRFTIAEDVPVDDHNAPALMRTGSGRYAALWSGHEKTPAFLRVSRTVNSIADWSPRRRLTGSGLEHVGASYAVLFRVPQQANSYVAIVRRKTDRLWVMTTSRDLKTWTPAFPLVRTIYPIDKREQPYLKFAFDGTALHVLGSDRQPGPSGPNKLYHFSIADGVVRRTDGTVVDTLANVQAGSPVDLRLTSLLYDGASADGQVRVYDIAVVNSEPIVAVTSDARTERAYKWARFRNGEWQLRTLVRQKAYPGGMTLDTADPRNVYLAYAPDGAQHGRIVHLRTADDGETWSVSETGDTPASRTPTTPVGSGGPWLAMWMRGYYVNLGVFNTVITGLTTGRRPIYLSVTWGRGWERGLRKIVLTVRQGYTSVAAEGVPIRVEVSRAGKTRSRLLGTTNRAGELKVRFSRIKPGSKVRFVSPAGPTWGTAATASRRAG